MLPDPVERVPRPRLFLLPGPLKTGSTALQFFFAENHEELIKQGFYYPNPGAAWGAGNAANFHGPEVEPLLKTYVQEARNLKCPNIILSSAVLSSRMTSDRSIFKFHQQLIKHCKPTVVLSVRELYEWFWSLVGQGVRVKTLQDMTANFHQDKWFGMKVMGVLPRWLEAFEDHIFVNYTAHRDNLALYVCTQMGIAAHRKGFKPTRKLNRSPTLSELNLFRKVYSKMNCNEDALSHVFRALMIAHPDKESFRHFDGALARRLYDKFAPLVRQLNMTYLKEEDYLDTEPFWLEKYSNKWDTTYVEKEDLWFVGAMLQTDLSHLGLKST